MIKNTIAASLIAVVAACSAGHIASTNATFHPLGPEPAGDAAQPGPLMLNVTRHIDTIINGPDIDEDQFLALEVHNFQLNQRLPIPSEAVTARFIATRFGPRSTGESFNGYLIVQKITAKQITAKLRLVVKARTESGRYSQIVKFRGNYIFYRNNEGQ
jgi:hypothetical protein